MTKLITAYLAAPTLKNAAKITAYAQKHPFALCLLPAEQAAMVDALCRISH